jgi:hypothetical protein
MTRPVRIRVRIDRLVIDGACLRGELFAAVIAEEFTRLAAAGAPPSAVADEVDADLVQAPVPAARAIAAALHAQLLAEVADA